MSDSGGSLHTVLVLGGYGFFGARISTEIARIPMVRVLVGGRNLEKARALMEAMGLPAENAVQMDARSDQLASEFKRLMVDTVIHTAGPFQGQDYAVALAAIEAGCHYIDLADGRAFVSGISALDTAARAKGVVVISGASSVPSLSSAVVDQYGSDFRRLDSIRAGISSGARAPGIATVKGVLGYCGKPFPRWETGVWTTTYGWLNTQRYRFPDSVGSRLLGSCDVPDLELFPRRYASVQTVTFHAGFAATLGHRVIWGLAGLVKLGLLASVAAFGTVLHRVSQWIEFAVSDQGGMFVQLEGLGWDGAPLKKTWSLIVSQNHGPYVPCGASIALIEKLAGGTPIEPGARPCMGMLTVAEYLKPLQSLAIREIPP